MIDWSDLGRKRGLPLLSWATTHDELTPSQNRLEDAFITRLLRNLPDTVRPLLLADRDFGRASLLRRLQEMPRHTGWTVDYVVRLKGNVHIQTADGYQGLLRKYPLPSGRYVFLPEAQYRSYGAVTVNQVLYWGRGHREPWYLATSLPDAKVAVRQYRKWMQLEQYFRDGKQYFALDRGTATTTVRLGRMLVGLLACCLLLLAGRRAAWQFRRRVCSWGQLAGTAAVGHGVLSGYARTPARMVRLAYHMKVGTPEASARHGRSRRQSGGRSRQRGLTTKLHLAVDAHGMPVRMLATAGTVADCTRAEALLGGIAAEYLLADRGYDTNTALAAAREYDRALYQARHLVESGFSKLKEWRGVATRHARNVASYPAICQIRALALRAKII